MRRSLPILPSKNHREGVLCPQQYDLPGQMMVVGCNRCPVGWNAAEKRCHIETGAEGYPAIDPAVEGPPECPIASRCQHQIQMDPDGLCLVRSRGMVCESALIFAGMSEKEIWDRPNVFNADCV